MPSPSGARGAAARLTACADRAALLAPQSPAARAPLEFAAGLFRAQARLAEALAARHAESPLGGHLDDDAPALLAPARAVAAFAASSGPALLAQAARERASEDDAHFLGRLRVFWDGDLGTREDYLSRALLRPYVATLVAASVSVERPRTPLSCPTCGGLPAVAVRRPESDSTKRLLCCALCGGEWQVNRIHCPACAEEDPVKLPTFQGEGFPFARIEACDTCRTYVKSIDVSLDGRPIPEVDDLCSIGLDLWAAEQGYARIEPGLAGL